MKDFIPLSFLAIFLFTSSCKNSTPALPHVSSGRLVRIDNFHSEYVASRDIDVWLPDGYDQSKKYSVLYFNDGQMLFDSSVTWNRQEWQVDEVMAKLKSLNRIKDCIVVAIFNNPGQRQNEYLPFVAINGMTEPARSSIISSVLGDKPLSDRYLQFIVNELKPMIDNKFSTNSTPESTFIIGSGLGGLISLYTLCKYPEVFGGAACLSTHWPVVGPGLYTQKIINGAYNSFRNYVQEHLPFLHARKIYFDYGTLALDRSYKPYQDRIDSLMVKEEFTRENWITREFKGYSGDDRSCGKRLSVPIEFLVGK